MAKRKKKNRITSSKKPRSKKSRKHLLDLTRGQEGAITAVISVIVLTLLWINYSSIPNFWVAANVALAVTGTLLIALSFLLGPIYRWLLPGYTPSQYRKMFGMIGFGIIAFHALISLTIRSEKVFSPGNELSMYAAIISFLIFSMLALSSNSMAFNWLGKEKWLQIQRMGYLALVLDFVHFYVVGGTRFLGSSLGQLSVLIVLLAIFARIVQLIWEKKSTDKSTYG